MLVETRKIMGLPDLRLSATCVRVPVAVGHSEALHIEFERPMSPPEAREILSSAPGIEVVDDPLNREYPQPIDAAGRDPVYVGPDPGGRLELLAASPSGWLPTTCARAPRSTRSRSRSFCMARPSSPHAERAAATAR